MSGAPFLTGPRVELRTIEEADLPFLRDTINAPGVRRFLFLRPPLNLAQEEEEFYETVIAADESVNLLITVDGDPAGTIGLTGADSVSGSAEIGLFMAENWWGEGDGTEAAELCTDYAFDERRLHRIFARIVAGNEASTRVFEKLGYRPEATLHEAVFINGAYHDVELYAVLEDEWREE